jgi:hypothetical protein
MKPNIKKLINDIPICDDAKCKVAALVEAIAPGIKIDFPKTGEVWLTYKERLTSQQDSAILYL